MLEMPALIKEWKRVSHDDQSIQRPNLTKNLTLTLHLFTGWATWLEEMAEIKSYHRRMRKLDAISLCTMYFYKTYHVLSMNIYTNSEMGTSRFGILMRPLFMGHPDTSFGP